jgi:hypothetical protein
MNTVREISQRSFSMALRNRFLNWSAAVLAAAFLSPSIPSAVAATITWGVAQNVSGSGSQVITTGTLLHAVGGPRGNNVTVNGVLFVSATSASTISFSGNISDNAAGGQTGISGAYQTLLEQRVWGNPFAINIGSLTIGQQYLIQAWSSAGQVAYTTSTTTLTAGNTVTLDTNVGNTVGNAGQFVTGTFTADATSQVVTVGGNVPLINAVQIRAVPEPSTLAMAALGIGGVWAFVRRRSRLKVEDSASESVM